MAEPEACRIFFQLVSAVAYLHSLNISHRDIKPSNILMDARNNIKLIDFGLGNTYAKGKALKTSCGSPCFAAPEIINGVEYDPVKVDVWSLGVSLFCMLCGRLPFDEDTKQELYKKIRACSYRVTPGLSSNAVNLIAVLLNGNPQARPNPATILTHPFFASHLPSPHQSLTASQADDLYLVVGEMTKVGATAVRKMILDNEHNKHTTVYYLMKKKTERGAVNIAAERARLAGDKKKEEISAKPPLKKLVDSKLYTDEMRRTGFRSNIRTLGTRKTDRQERSRPILDAFLSKQKTDGSTSTNKNNFSLLDNHRGSLRIGSAKAMRTGRNNSLPQEKDLKPAPKTAVHVKNIGMPRNMSTGSREDHQVLINKSSRDHSATPSKTGIDVYKIHKLSNVTATAISAGTGGSSKRKQSQPTSRNNSQIEVRHTNNKHMLSKILSSVSPHKISLISHTKKPANK